MSGTAAAWGLNKHGLCGDWGISLFSLLHCSLWAKSSTSNSRAHPREEGMGMALTGPGSPTMLWVSPSHFIPEETEAQRNAQLSPRLADRVGRSVRIPGRQHPAEFREVRPITETNPRRPRTSLLQLWSTGDPLSGQGAEFIWSLWAPPRQAPRPLHSKLSGSFPNPSLKDQQAPEGSPSPRLSKEPCLGELGSSPYYAL